MRIKKNTAVKYSVCVAIFVFGALLLLKRAETAENIRSALTLCGEILIPSMFPFMVLSSFAVNSGVLTSSGRLISFIMKKIFHLSGDCFSAVFFGFTGGYPVGARTISDLCERKIISRSEARHLFAFCINSGPAFTVAAAGGMMLNSEKAGYLILLSVCLSSVIVGIVLGIVRRKEEISPSFAQKREYELSTALVSSVANASSGMFSVCAWLLIFSAVSGIIRPVIGDGIVLKLYDIFSEVTTGIKDAASFGGVSLCASCIAFGGICVLCQNMPYIKKCGIKVREYLFFRILNSVLTYFISYTLLKFIPVNVSVSYAGNVCLYSSNVPASAALMIMGGILIFELSYDETKRMKLSEHLC